MNLIILPFAGGTRHSFNELKSLIADTEITGTILEYPGRGDRFAEPLVSDIQELVNDAFERLAALVLPTKENYVLYGHSMGGLVGYLLCQKIQGTSFPSPVQLIVSGSPAPSKRKEGEKSHALPSDFFWDTLHALGGVPDELLAEPALRLFFEPILKSDFKAVEEYRYSVQSKLDIPIDVFYGSEEGIKEEQVLAWQEETTEKVEIKKLTGNHFFIYDHTFSLVEHFLNLMNKHKSQNV